MKKTIAVLLVIICLSMLSISCNTTDVPDEPGIIADTGNADTLFEKGQFQEALKIYEKVHETAVSSEIKTKAFMRMCESNMHLFRYGKAAALLINTPLPAMNADKARVLVMKAELLQIFKNQYSSILNSDRIDDPDNSGEVFSLSKNQIEQKIEKTYNELSDMKDQLLAMKLEDQKYYFMVKDVDFSVFPTLYDFYIFNRVKYLLQGQLVEGNDINFILNTSFTKPPASSQILFAAGLMDAAHKLHQNNYPAASEHWQIRRITAIFEQGWKTEFYEQYADAQKKAIDILQKWMETFTTGSGRAEAGFQTAKLYNQMGEYSTAKGLCEKIIEQYKSTRSGINAAVLRQQIINPAMSVQIKNMTPSIQKTITISARNLEKIYFRAYKIEGKALLQLENDPSLLHNLHYNYNENKLIDEILKQNPAAAWNVETGDIGKHEYISKTIAPPQLSEGLYILSACNADTFKPGSTLLQRTLLNVSSLMLVATPGVTTKTRDAYYSMLYNNGPESSSDTLMHFYTVDIHTGKQIANTDIFTAWYENYGSHNKKTLKTNMQGQADFAAPVNLHWKDYSQFSVYPLARKGNSYSYLRNQENLYYSTPEPIQIFTETDRPIYRPGDTVQIKLSAVRTVPDGFRTIDKANVINFSASDPNGNEIISKKLTLNDYGTTHVSFEIPRGRLLGRYYFDAATASGILTGYTSGSFTVEEYKRPEFEITLKEALKEFQFEKEAAVTGNASYYFGGAVENAAIHYTISKNTYIPWYYSYWMYNNYSDGQNEIASGDITADSKGDFSITFTPKKEHINMPSWIRSGLIPEIAQYTINVEARDEGGRTITASSSYKVGRQGFYFIIEPDRGFYRENEPINVSAKKLTINDVPQKGSAEITVYKLKNPPLKTWAELEYPYSNYGEITANLPGIDFQLKDAEIDTLAYKSTVSFPTDGKASVTIPSLPEGAFRITFKEKDSSGQEVIQEKIILVTNTKGNEIPVNLTAVTVSDKNDYTVGETASVLLGSGFTSGSYIAELWSGRYFIKNIFIDNSKPVQVLDIPITKDMKGGFSIRWFGVKDTEIFYGTIRMDVPWAEKTLALKLDPFDKILLPGKEASWGISVKDRDGKPADAEVLMLMYDRSLEYYAQSGSSGFASLYLQNSFPDTASSSIYQPWFYNIQITDKNLYNQLYNQYFIAEQIPNVFAARTFLTRRGYYNMDQDYDIKLGSIGFTGKKSEESIMEDRASPSPVSETRSTNGKLDSISGLDNSRVDKSNANAPDIQTRKAFADTAFFLPHVETTNGTGTFTFIAPEQLTSWKIKAIALTPDVSFGTLEEEAVTKKDLMVRLDLPRFFREKDKGTVTVMVHNESDKKLTGSVIIDVREEGESVIKKINLFGPQKSFSINAHSLTSIDWSVEIPTGMTSYTFRATATAGTLGDAEERVLPILPSRQRLIESAFKVLKGSGTHTISIPMKDDPTRIGEQVVLQIDPQLTLNILNTLPFLIDYPYSCTEQTLNRYVPLAIVNALYNEYPEVKQHLSKIPKRDTTTPPWEADDPQRLIELQETPWGWESKGRPSIWPVIDMLDPDIVASHQQTTFSRLASLQLSSGGFPWMPGGRANLYMTLYVLAGLAEAQKYGVEIPHDIINRALAYLNNEIPQNYKPDTYSVAIVAYASYVVTRFSKSEYSAAGQSHELIKKWLSFLEEHIYALTPFGKAYLAAAYLALDNTKRGDEVLAMALDGSQVDPIVGVYWTPEEYSWVWYSDTVEKHAFFLKLLQQYKPDDPRIDGMVQWLLFNKTGNVWKSTKASAAAIFALLDYLKAGGALFADESYSFFQGSEKQTLDVKGTDFNEKPFRFITTGSDITDESLSVDIKKQGKGTSFTSLTFTYTTDQIPEASGPGLIEMSRTFYIRVKENNEYVLKPVKSGGTVTVGDQIEVHLKIKTKSQFEYMHIKDPKTAGFEAETLTSGWKYQPLWFYEEPRDSATNFFFDWLPQGEYVLKYRLRPTKPGEYRVGAATLQSMYAPELTAHSDGFVFKVEK